MSKRISYRTNIAKITDHNPTTRELKIEFIEPHSFIFRAGQFAMLNIPSENPAKPILRAYSIASDDRIHNSFRLIFKFVPGGVASNFVWKLKENMELIFTGPFGRVFFQEPAPEQNFFLCTGTGLAQHLSYLESKLDLFPKSQFRTVFGVREDSDVFYEKELETLSQKFPNFQYQMYLSRPSPAWTGKKGYIQDSLTSFDFNNANSAFYICGNKKMIHDVKHILIEKYYIDPSRIHSEAFY